MSNSAQDSTDIATKWWSMFWDRLQQPDVAAPLKSAAVGGDLTLWTTQLTCVVVQSSQDMSWRAAAKGYPLDLMAQAGQEYLGIDVMAFAEPPPSGTGQLRWRLPIAAFELENSRSSDRVAYSLWKVMCLRVALRVVFAYRGNWEEARSLIIFLTHGVIGELSTLERAALTGETLVVVGSRGEGSTFPWGYFKVWKLEANVGRFEKV